MQACCVNFNNAITSLFGLQYGLEKRLPIALQFVSFGADQRAILKRADGLPEHVDKFISAFENELTDEEQADPAFRMHIAFVPIVRNRASNADRAIEFVKPGSDKARAVNEVLLKEVSKRRHTATMVVEHARKQGYSKFSIHHHTNLWKQLDAKILDKGYGCRGDYKNTWIWFDSWIARVLDYCKKNADRYT